MAQDVHPPAVAGSEVIETALGRIEYTVYGSTGPLLLFLHGQPGGYDQGSVLAEAAVQHGFRLITVSRPGYLRTPLAVGQSPGEQADACAALLDALGSERVAVVSLSGGGPAGIQFALRHPDRCSALVAIAVVSGQKGPPTEFLGRLLQTKLLTSDFAGWLIGTAVKRRPDLLGQALVPDVAAQAAVLSDPVKRAALYGIAQTGIQLPAQRRRGSENDVAQFAALPIYPVETIRVPTLVIHGTADKLVPYSHALFLAENVPGAELEAIVDGTHAIIVTHFDQVLSWLFAFLSAQG